MRKRIVLGSMMVAGLAALLWWDHHLGDSITGAVGLPIAVVMGALLAVGFVEFARLAAAAELPTMPATGAVAAMILGLLPVWAQWLPGGGAAPAVLPVVAAIVAACFLVQMIRHRTDAAMRRIGGTLFGVLYLGLAAWLLLIRVHFGMPALVMVLAAVKGTDIGAYLVGSQLGRHKLIPWLSAGKSWEGLAGGFAAAVGAAVGLNAAFGPGLELWGAALTGGVLCLVGQFGDLCESLIKRDAGLKDSAGLIPEFGGVLDLLDSLLLAAPAAYALLALLL